MVQTAKDTDAKANAKATAKCRNGTDAKIAVLRDWL